MTLFRWSASLPFGCQPRCRCWRTLNVPVLLAWALQTSAASNSTWLRTPSSRSTNAAFSRTPIQKRKTIQLRAAAFNLPNHLNPSTPNTSPLSNTLGYQRQRLRPDHQRHPRKQWVECRRLADHPNGREIRILTTAPTLRGQTPAGHCRACRRCGHSRSSRTTCPRRPPGRRHRANRPCRELH